LNQETNALNKSEATTVGTRLDRFGAVASLACAAHCAAMPLLIGLLPFIGLSFLADQHTESLLVGLSMGIGILSLGPSYARKHRQWRPLLLFISGACLIIAVKLLTEDGSRLEAPAMVLGALMIACAHIINRRLCRSCAACHPVGE
jgi:ABC-type Fe3+-siderophore transport system permease subunit